VRLGYELIHRLAEDRFRPFLTGLIAIYSRPGAVVAPAVRCGRAAGAPGAPSR